MFLSDEALFARRAKEAVNIIQATALIVLSIFIIGGLMIVL